MLIFFLERSKAIWEKMYVLPAASLKASLCSPNAQRCKSAVSQRVGGSGTMAQLDAMGSGKVKRMKK